MKQNYKACYAHVMRWEGGWADDPHDPGGPTMKGVTQRTYSAFLGRPATKDELRNIPEAHLQAIYKQNYWDAIRGDDLPSGLDLVTFDAAVNSGPSRGAKWTQEAVGAQADGQIGPKTLLAIRSANVESAIRSATASRLAFMQSLKIWPRYKNGWQSRVDETYSKALSMVSAPAQVKSPASGLAALIAAIIKAISAIFGVKK